MKSQELSNVPTVETNAVIGVNQFKKRTFSIISIATFFHEVP